MKQRRKPDFGQREQRERDLNRMARAPRKQVAPAPRGHFPAYVTDGVNADGSLRVLIFKDRASADAAGYQWVGR